MGGIPGTCKRVSLRSLKLLVVWLCSVGKWRRIARVEAQELK